MTWIVAILSVFLIIVCLLLMLLVLIQLPKKEAGMGQAFGGSTTDALFGAGSGTALTKMTKYTTGIFFVLTLLLGILKAQEVKHSSNLEERMRQLEKSSRSATAPVAPSTPANPSANTPDKSIVLQGTNAPTNASKSTLLLSAPPKADTNAPAAEEPVKPK